jgi:DNA polymerase III delta subunit
MIYQNIALFQRHLKDSFPNGLSSYYLVVSSNAYERMRIMDNICRFLPHESGFTLNKIDCEKTALQSIINELSTPSLFGREQITVLDELSYFKRDDIKVILQLILKNGAFGRLVMGAKSKEDILPLYKELEKRGVVLDFLLEKPWEKEKRLVDFIVERCAQAKKTISPFIAKELLHKVGLDMAMVEQEVEKLLTYVDQKANIDKDDVDRAASSTNNATFWQLAEKILWDGNMRCLENIFIDASFFQGILIALRYQLQVGYKIASFLEAGKPLDERFFRMNSKALMQKQEMALKLKSSFFKSGLKLLFDIELMSKGGVDDFLTLINYFSCKVRLGR